MQGDVIFSMKWYDIHEVKHCADYQGIILEGRVKKANILLKLLIVELDKKIHKKISLDNGKIIIYYHKDFTMYIYDGGRFILSQLTEEQVGYKFMESINIKGE